MNPNCDGSKCRSLSALVEQRAELLADEAEGPALADIAKRVRELEAREHEARARIAELEAALHRALHSIKIARRYMTDPQAVGHFLDLLETRLRTELEV